MDKLFLIGIFLLPFENFFFAPSSGWAAISPLVFFIYVIFQREYFNVVFKKYFPIFVIAVLCAAISCFDYLVLGSVYVENVVDTLGTLVLGLTCLYSFDIYLNIKGRSLDGLIRILVAAYFIAFLVGVVQLIAVKLGIGPLLNGFEFLLKRNYLPRIQFMFTEPSFTTMHLFGVLLPFYMASKDRRIIWLIVGFVAISLFSSSSLRLVVDSIVVLALVAINYADWKKVKTYFMALVLPCLLIGVLVLAMQTNPRVEHVIEDGFDSDASYASRMFRIEAVLEGFAEDPLKLIAGYGAGNVWMAIQAGYDTALMNYDNPYTGEVDSLGSSRPTSMFCMYARIVAEYGIVVMAIILFALLRLNNEVKSRDWRLLLIVCAYLYFQFDGYAFYAIWVVIVLRERFIRIKDGGDSRTGIHANQSFLTEIRN